MRNLKFFFVFAVVFCLMPRLNAAFVESLKIKEIIDNNTKYRNEELIISGEITSITYRETMGLYIVDMNSNGKNDDKKSLETNIYFVSDETAGIYVLSIKHYEEKQKVTFKTKVLMNSEEKVGDDQAILYDKYIAAKTGFSSPSYSRYMLEELLKNALKEKPWVLLIDIE